MFRDMNRRFRQFDVLDNVEVASGSQSEPSIVQSVPLALQQVLEALR